MTTNYEPTWKPLFEMVPDSPGGVRVKETEAHYIDVVPMIFNHRVVMTPKADPLCYDRGWCYQARAAALLAAMEWDPDIEPEPRGWVKALDGTHRRRPDGDAGREYVQP